MESINFHEGTKSVCDSKSGQADTSLEVDQFDGNCTTIVPTVINNSKVLDTEKLLENINDFPNKNTIQNKNDLSNPDRILINFGKIVIKYF